MKPGAGMFWQIDDPKQSLPDAIAEASRRFRQKYGVEPNEIILNAAEMQAAGMKEMAFRVSTSPLLTPRHIHLWGVPEDGQVS